MSLVSLCFRLVLRQDARRIIFLLLHYCRLYPSILNYFLPMKTPFNILTLGLFFFLSFSGCKESDDPVIPVGPAPTLTGFSPTSGTVGTIVTLTGTNFSTTIANNLVKFNGTAATITAAYFYQSNGQCTYRRQHGQNYSPSRQPGRDVRRRF